MQGPQKKGSLRRAKLAVPVLSLIFLNTFWAPATRTRSRRGIWTLTPHSSREVYSGRAPPHLPQIITLSYSNCPIVLREPHAS